MAPPRKAAAAAGTARSASRNQRHPSRAVRELQAGLELLQQPLNEASMLAALHHLQAAIPPSRSPMSVMHRIIQEQPAGEEGYVLKLLNQHLQWFMSGVTQPLQPMSTAATGGERSNSSSSANSSSRRTFIMVRTNGSDTPPYEVRLSSMCSCLDYVFYFLAAYSDDVTAGKVRADAVRDQLLDMGTGTCSLLSQAIHLVVRYPAELARDGPAPYTAAQLAQEQMRRYTALMGIWYRCAHLAFLGAEASLNIWSQAPAFAQALPAVAHLMHIYLTTPPSARINAHLDDAYMLSLMRQLVALVEGAAAADGHSNRTSCSSTTTASSTSSGSSGSSSSSRSRRTASASGSMQQQQQQQQQQAATQGPGQGNISTAHAPACTLQNEALFPHKAKALVERFLWHALATAAAAWESHEGPTAHSSSEGRGSNNSRSRAHNRSKYPFPPGACYQLQLSRESATEITRQAATMLLQLATGGLTQQQLLEVTAATSQLQQEQAAQAAAASARLTGEWGAVAASLRNYAPYQDAGYLCWPIAPAAVPGHSPGVYNSSNGGGGGSGGSRSSGAATTCATPPPTSCSPGGAQQATLTSNGNPDNTPTTANNSSSSRNDVPHDTGTGLQLLAASSGCLWRVIQEQLGVPLHQAALKRRMPLFNIVRQAQALTHVVLLVVQQLQAAPSEVRSSFLHSPAGNAVLQVLNELSSGPGVGQAFSDVYVGAGAQGPGAQQEEQQGASGWRLCTLLGEDVVQQLLLPGLLLQLVPAGEGSFSSCQDRSSSVAADGDNSGPSSSSGSSLSTSRDDSRSSSGVAGSSAEISNGSVANSRTDNSSMFDLQGAATVDDAYASCSSVMLNVNLRSFEEAKLLSLVAVPHTAMLVPPGCTPPPAALFLAERLLRGDTLYVPALALAIELLRGSVSVLVSPQKQQQQQHDEKEEEEEQQQQQQEQDEKEQEGEQQQQEQQEQRRQEQHQPVQASSPSAAKNAGAVVQMQQLAYCSLSRTVVQAAATPGPLALCAPDMMCLADDLISLAEQDACQDRASSDTNGGRSSSSSSSSSSSRDSASRQGGLSFAASLAAAVAAGSYTAHITSAQLYGGCADWLHKPAESSSSSSSSSSSISADAAEIDPSSATTTAISGNGGGTAATADAGNTLAAAGGPVPKAVTCDTCLRAMEMLAILRRLEDGAALPAEALAAGMAASAQQPGNFLHTQLEKALVALTLRHPVPYVCGNMFCRHVQSAAAVGQVRCKRGTLCGGCRAAWYCCKECQRFAWKAHREVCRGRG